MKVYADAPGKRTRQLLQDAIVVCWIVIWVVLGTIAHDVVAKLAGPAAAVARNSDSLGSSLEDISDQVDEVPVVGGALEEPFSTAAQGARGVANESRKQRENFLTAALWIGLLIALAPIAAVLLLFTPWRLRWIREATAAERIRVDADDLYLFALRAVANMPLSKLRQATPDPGAALAAGDYEALARLELQRLGLRP